MTDERIRELHEHLVATQERPVDREASRWIGEAEAVAGDLVGGDVDPTVAARRLGHVRDLLAEVDSTDDAEADEHVAAAQDLTADLLDSLPDEDAG
jgi:hypothetical protein